MADLTTTFAGITSPNPFWLASGPPANTGDQVARAFEAGWGGAVWKTIGVPVENTWSRYSSVDLNGQRMMGLNNIELITDRSLDVNLKEIREVKRRFPNHAVVVSAMVESNRDDWHTVVKQIQDTGADAVELNFGCPHGMSERGMGSAIGQVPEYCSRITEWAVEVAEIPVIVKLTPNITDIRSAARAAKAGGADAISLINTLNSITGVDLDTFTPRPSVGAQSSHGGYCGPAVKPIALNMVAAIARDPETAGVPISGIGGVTTWRDAAEFLLLGAANVQVCTAVMHYGFRIVEGLIDGLSNYLDAKGMSSVADLQGLSVGRVTEWQHLDLNYIIKAQINQETCIGCALCYIACNDGAHQAIGGERSEDGRTKVWIKYDDCVGCNLCALVCPVDGCITMVEQDTEYQPLTWSEYESGADPATLAPRPKHGLTLGE